MFLTRTILFICILVCGLSAYALGAPGNLSGTVAYSYAQLRGEEAGEKVLEASHFTQKYSLLYERKGQLNRGRAGEYDYALGYEWNWIDSETNGTSAEIDNPLDKILFSGDILLAPGGLPFRLHFYSRDLNETSVGYSPIGELFRGKEFDSQPGIIDSSHNNMHVTTGLTLMAGISNGNYRGHYRDLLVSMPKIFIDFRQDDVRDVDGPDPIHYTDRNLAFVSLNKNKNWFHYRFFTHEDKINPENDHQAQTFLLGTVNHTNRREWVDLTNWIKISTDLSFTETSPNVGASVTQQKRYDLNFMTSFDYGAWRGNSFANYSLVREPNRLFRQLTVPIFLKGQLNRNTTWRFRLESRVEEESVFALGEKDETSSLYMSSRVDTFRQQKYVLAPTCEAELKEGMRGEGYAVRAGLEVYDNPRYRDDTDLFGSYSVAVFDGTGREGDVVSYVEQNLKGRVEQELGTSLRGGFEQTLLLGQGSYADSVTDYVRAYAEVVAESSAAESGVLDGTVWQSLTTLFVDHRSEKLINNRVELVYGYLSSPSGRESSQLTLAHNLNYDGAKLDFSLDNKLVIGDSLSGREEVFGSSDSLDTTTEIAVASGVETSSFSSIARMGYSPDRVHRLSASAEVEWREFEDDTSDQRYEFEQRYEYTLWKDNGLFRKIASFGEELEYEVYQLSDEEGRSLVAFTLFSDYYPTKNTLLGVRLRYELDGEQDSGTAYLYLTAGADFSKFQVDLNYAYGTRDAGVGSPDRVEHKWEVKVRKTF